MATIGGKKANRVADEKLKELSMAAASALSEEWSIGEFMTFCDDEPDFDEADIKEIAEKILPFLVEAMKVK